MNPNELLFLSTGARAVPPLLQPPSTTPDSKGLSNRSWPYSVLSTLVPIVPRPTTAKQTTVTNEAIRVATITVTAATNATAFTLIAAVDGMMLLHQTVSLTAMFVPAAVKVPASHHPLTLPYAVVPNAGVKYITNSSTASITRVAANVGEWAT